MKQLILLGALLCPVTSVSAQEDGVFLAHKQLAIDQCGASPIHRARIGGDVFSYCRAEAQRVVRLHVWNADQIQTFYYFPYEYMYQKQAENINRFFRGSNFRALAEHGRFRHLAVGIFCFDSHLWYVSRRHTQDLPRIITRLIGQQGLLLVRAIHRRGCVQ